MSSQLLQPRLSCRLVLSIWNNWKDSLKSLDYNTNTLKAKMQNISSIVEQNKFLVPCWDFCNQILGQELNGHRCSCPRNENHGHRTLSLNPGLERVKSKHVDLDRPLWISFILLFYTKFFWKWFLTSDFTFYFQLINKHLSNEFVKDNAQTRLQRTPKLA